MLEERNMAKYGNPLGPTADQLHAKYGSWGQVIDASMRTSHAVDRELSLEYRPCPVQEPRRTKAEGPHLERWGPSASCPAPAATARVTATAVASR
ncbi:hypothetical protein GCM10010272_07260 [Streptomyces lateritius]|nr:hypothetical protein GCM10010272_07260 [Streptomyces lateritius]